MPERIQQDRQKDKATIHTETHKDSKTAINTCTRTYRKKDAQTELTTENTE